MPEEPISVEGNLATVDLEKRFFTLENREGVIFIRIDWDPLPYFDQKMRKQKIGYYEKPVVVMTGENTARLKELEYTARLVSFPKRQQQKGGGRPFQPRNEKIIVYQCTYKEACETVRRQLLVPQEIFDEAEFNRVMDIALARAIKDGKALIEAGGA